MKCTEQHTQIATSNNQSPWCLGLEVSEPHQHPLLTLKIHAYMHIENNMHKHTQHTIKHLYKHAMGHNFIFLSLFSHLGMYLMIYKDNTYETYDNRHIWAHMYTHTYANIALPRCSSRTSQHLLCCTLSHQRVFHIITNVFDNTQYKCHII